MAQTLRESVNAAVVEQTENQDQAESKLESKTSLGETTDESTQDDEVVESDLTTEEIQEATLLYKALKDPSQGRNVVENLARQAGFLAEKTGVTKTEAKDFVLEILKEELGPENEDLAVKFGPAIKKILDTALPSAVKPVQDRLLEQEAQQAEQLINNTIDNFFAQNEDAKTHEKRMVELMGKIQPNGISMQEYVEMIYNLASGKQAKTSTKTSTDNANKTAKIINRISKNAKEAAKTVSSDVDETRVKAGSHRPTAREAVMQALEEQMTKSQR